MGYTVSFFSYATKRKSCEFARISSIIVRISLSVEIKKDSVESISAIYAVFRLCNARKVVFRCVFKLLPYVALALMASPFYLYGTKRLCTEKKKMPEYPIGILRLV